jgi:hypothetical protein
MASKPIAERSWTIIDGVDLVRGLAILFVLLNRTL